MVPYLYTIIDKQRISDMLKAFYTCVGLPIPVIDDTGALLESQGDIHFLSAAVFILFCLTTTSAANFMQKRENGQWNWGKLTYFPATPT